MSWRVAAALLKLREQVDAVAPGRNTDYDGTIGDAAHASRDSDHNPWVQDAGRGVVTAMDITHDPAAGCDAGRLAEALRHSRDVRVKYIIWNQHIVSSSAIGGAGAWEWRPYSGANPHDHHVHVSVQPYRSQYDATEPWHLHL
jgi:hypothetical protein